MSTNSVKIPIFHFRIHCQYYPYSIYIRAMNDQVVPISIAQRIIRKTKGNLRKFQQVYGHNSGLKLSPKLTCIYIKAFVTDAKWWKITSHDWRPRTFITD